MRHAICVAAAALLALAALGINGAAAAGGSTTMFAPLWVFPPQPRAAPVTIVNPPPPGTVVIREQPSLLTPADLRFSVETENDVVVVRGPRAR